MEFAVNIPEQDPQVGQAERSIAATSSSVSCGLAAATMASTRSSFNSPRSPRRTLPASIGPPKRRPWGY